MNTTESMRSEAEAGLTALGRELERVTKRSETSTQKLHDLITWVRSTGKVSVNEMAETMDRARNYVDSVWSISSRAGKVIDPEDFGLSPYADEYELKSKLNQYSNMQRAHFQELRAIRKERDQAVVMVYASRVLGPSDIARHVGIDRNHVGRLARSAGVSPQHRWNIKNQYSDQPQPEQPVEASEVGAEQSAETASVDAAA